MEKINNTKQRKQSSFQMQVGASSRPLLSLLLFLEKIRGYGLEKKLVIMNFCANPPPILRGALQQKICRKKCNRIGHDMTMN
jgi:hypothetical protein